MSDRKVFLSRESLEEALCLILDAIFEGKYVVVLTHANPDFDAAASAKGVSYLVELITGAPAPIFFGGSLSARFEALDFDGHPLKELIELKRLYGDTIYLVLTDAPNSRIPHVSWNIKPTEFPVPDLVLDHHSGEPNGRFNVIEPDAGSASTIVLGLLALYTQSEAKPRFVLHPLRFRSLATLMQAAVLTDNAVSLSGKSPFPVPPLAQCTLDFLDSHADIALIKHIFEMEQAEVGEHFERVQGCVPLEDRQSGTMWAWAGELTAERRHWLSLFAETFLETWQCVCVAGYFSDSGEFGASLRAPIDVDAAEIATSLFTARYAGGRKNIAGAHLPFEALGIVERPGTDADFENTVFQAVMPFRYRFVDLARAAIL